MAHDLYNELKQLVSELQSIAALRELPVVLLVMMVAFFTLPAPPAAAAAATSSSPTANTSSSSTAATSKLKQSEKVIRVHDYYTHKLQVSKRPAKP